MNLLYCSDSFTPHDRLFLQTMKETGSTVSFLCLKLPDVLDALDVPLGVDVVSLPPHLRQETPTPESMVRFEPFFREMVRELAPSVIHAGPVQHAGYLASLAGAHPLLLMSWGSDILVNATKNKQYEEATRRALQGADIFFSDCQAVLDVARKFHPVPPEKTLQIPWGTDIQAFTPRNHQVSGLRSQLGWQDCFVLIWTRSWEDLYGIRTFVESFCQAARVLPQLRLILVGSGSLSHDVNAVIRDQQLVDRVSMPGRISRSQLPHYYQAADMYVSASTSDGTSVSLLEAMACGLPVLVSDIPSNREWVKEDVNGWFAQPGNADAFLRAIVSAAKMSRKDLYAMQTRNREVVEKRADWQNNKKLLLQIYSRLASRGVHTR